MKVGSGLEIVKDYLFPHFCIKCGNEGEWWCLNCRKDKTEIINRAEGELKCLTALFNYQKNEQIETLIKEFKYGLVRDLEHLWREMILENKISFSKDMVLIPVPLYKRRQRERGYNQAEMLGQILSSFTGCILQKDILVRNRETKQQAKLGLQERLENVKGAFEHISSQIPKKIVLVDDVFTTGATMNECARVLRKSGATEICGFVLAHG